MITIKKKKNQETSHKEKEEESKELPAIENAEQR